MHVGVVGAGYVGLVTGTCFAEMGNDVMIMDIDELRIEGLLKGRVPIYEPGLEQMVGRNMAEQRLHFTTDITTAVENSLIIFIAVGTPPDEDGCADLTQVYSVAREIGRCLNNYKIIVTKSTVPVGLLKKSEKLFRKKRVISSMWPPIRNFSKKAMLLMIA